MSNEINLIPFSERTPEERREYGRMGGIKSGIARRAKRDAIKQRVIEMSAEKELQQTETERMKTEIEMLKAEVAALKLGKNAGQIRRKSSI